MMNLEQETQQNSPADAGNVQALLLAVLDEQRRSRRWANVFRMVAIAFLAVFLIAMYSNQYVATHARLTHQQAEACQLNLETEHRL